MNIEASSGPGGAAPDAEPPRRHDPALVIFGVLVVVGSALFLFLGMGGPAPGASSESGGLLYAQTCARCHGAGGEGIPPNPPLAGRDLRRDSVRERILQGGERMPPFGYLSEAKREAITEYVLGLSRPR